MVVLLSAVSVTDSLYAQIDNPFEASSLGQIKHNLICNFEIVGLTGGGLYAPFWHTSNRQGLPSVKKDNGYIHYAALGDMLMSSGLNMSYGVDLGAGAGLQNKGFVHQLYVNLDYKWLNLSIGMKERWGELKNPYLSSGGLTWSGNSQPVPQIRIGVPEYIRLPFWGSWFSVKGHIAYGRFIDDKWRKNKSEYADGKNRYTDRLLFHSKDIFLRIGDKDRFPFEATIGIEMYSMFGGTLHNRTFNTMEIQPEYELPSGPQAYFKALLPFNSVGEQGKENGNILGSWHLSLNYVGQEWGVRAYYEHFFEDHSSMIGIEYKSDLDESKSFVFYGFRRNWFDGLYGLEISLPERFPVRNVVFEVLNTRGQCGSIRKDQVYPVAEGVDGRDDMYNHDLYDSYSMSGYALGSPVLVSPVYNNDDNQRFRSNRVLMYHIGIDGALGAGWGYRALFTNTAHWGTYENPFNEIQNVTSCLLESTYRSGGVYGWRFGFSVGFDFNDGDLIGNNTGIMFSIAKTWKML